MKALSVKQPWASLIASGEKTIETRVWATKYRGPLLICASAAPRNWGPSGVTICTADLVDCRPMTKRDEVPAMVAKYPRAHSWVLENIRPVRHVSIRGQLGLFDPPDFYRTVFQVWSP